MTKTDRNGVRVFVFAAAMVAVAFGCRRVVVCFDNAVVDNLLNYIRTFIYIALYCAWGISVGRRVVQSQARRLLTIVSVLMTSWFILREVKYRFVFDEGITRYFWYLYYIPLLAIPLLAFFVALSSGKGEDFRLPKWTRVFLLVTIALVALVLTNDFHSLVFSFPESTWTEFNRKLGAFYYALIAWGVFLIISALAVMVKKCRIPDSRRFMWLPLCPFVFALVYFTLYTLDSALVKSCLSDFAAVCCVLFLCFFESCIRCGLIQSNSRYSDLFSASVITAVQITDNDYNVVYSAKSAEALPRETLRKAQSSPVMLDGGRILKNMPVNGGRAVWVEDISELLKLRETLNDRSDELRERNELLRYEIEREEEHRVIEEQNRLYDLLQIKTQAQLDSIDLLVQEYSRESDTNTKRAILARIAVLGSYIKRSKDFVLSTDESYLIPVGKLESALRESYRSLGFLNIRGSFIVNAERVQISGKLLMRAYDFFEDVAESVFDSAKFLNVRAFDFDGILRMNILTDCITDDSSIRSKYPDAVVIREDDGTAFILDSKGGEADD